MTGANLKAVLNSGDSLRMDVSEGMPLTFSMLFVFGCFSVFLFLVLFFVVYYFKLCDN